jgi:hypothetical protein
MAPPAETMAAFMAAQATNSLMPQGGWTAAEPAHMQLRRGLRLVPPDASDSANGSYVSFSGQVAYRPAERLAPAWIGWVSLIGIGIAVIAPFINFVMPSPYWLPIAGAALFGVAGALWIGKRSLA